MAVKGGAGRWRTIVTNQLLKPWHGGDVGICWGMREFKTI